MNEVDLYYLDTSALLPYYREEEMSRLVQDFLSSITPPVLISDLTRVEFVSAVSRWHRMEEINETQANVIVNTFTRDVSAGLFLCKQLEATHYTQAEKWLSARKTPLRTLDALHLACGWNHKTTVVTCDKIMQKSADVLGIKNAFLSTGESLP